jgi:catechol 2,3-dioxygenase-like lactoylglutathione lyase family enzyme
MPFTRVDHIGFTVSDMDRSCEFYSHLLEEEPALRISWDDVDYVSQNVGYEKAAIDGAFFPLPGGAMLELLQYRNPASGRVDMGTFNVGNSHLCLATDDIGAELERLSGHATIRSGPIPVTGGPYVGGYLCYIRDPDDISIELVQYAPGFVPPSTQTATA